MLAIGQQHKLTATGSSCTVPSHDVCKLSYFLHCGTVGCGIDIIVDDLLDYEAAHRLSKVRQDAIFKLAYSDYDDDALLGKTIFPVEDGHPLLKGSTNKFYSLEEVSSLIAVGSSKMLIAGQQTTVAKIMVCTKGWLTRYYDNPINKNSSRIRRIMNQSQDDDNGELLSTLLALLST